MYETETGYYCGEPVTKQPHKNEQFVPNKTITFLGWAGYMALLLAML